MKKMPLITGFCASIAMLILILDSQTALNGARTGIELCMRTVIPSLFPFFLLSILLTSSLSGLSLKFLLPLGKLCGIPQGAEPILISGFLGGYPVGAQSIGAAYRAGQLSREDAQRMLSFCSNAGPAFLFGMAASMFSYPITPWVLWGIHILSAILVALILPGRSHSAARTYRKNVLSLTEALRSAIYVMAGVCGWVILFRVMIAFLSRWVLWLLPAAAQVAVMGLLELSNGCCELLYISDPALRFVICSVFLACGGLCVAMQTRSVIGGLSIKSYFGGKFLQSAFSLLLSCAVVFKLWIPCITVLFLAIIGLRKKQKKGSIPAAVGV